VSSRTRNTSLDARVADPAQALQATASAPGEYSPREPTRSLLYRTLHRELEPFLARANLRRHATPGFVEQTLRAYLQCGVLATRLPPPVLRHLPARTSRPLLL